MIEVNVIAPIRSYRFMVLKDISRMRLYIPVLGALMGGTVVSLVYEIVGACSTYKLGTQNPLIIEKKSRVLVVCRWGA